jgi:hypothetical protein
MRDQGIDKKPGKRGFNGCGLLIFLLMVENLESSEMLKETPEVHP